MQRVIGPCGVARLACLLALASLSGHAMAQAGATFVDAKSNIFGYGVGTPAPGGGGGGVLAFTIDLNPGTSRSLSITANGEATWGGGAPNGPDGGFFAAATNIASVGPISGFAAPRSGHLVGLFLEAGDPAGLPAPDAILYPDAASLTALSYSPGIRQVFFLGDGVTGTGSGELQTFLVPDGATRLVFGIADAFGFAGAAGYYNDNTGGYSVAYTIVPTPGTALLLGIGLACSTRRRR
jgi:hypothetical protein